jgi:hypothetical protein
MELSPDLKLVLIVAGCLVLPGVWGWLVYWAFHRLRLRQRFPPPVLTPADTSTKADQAWSYQI